MNTNKKNNLFNTLAELIADWMGRSWSFIFSLTIITIWLMMGPIWKFSDTWQLFINTVTSVITFLMVFIIQNTQNRNNKVTKLMMNEIIVSIAKANTKVIHFDELSDEELKKLEKQFKKLSKNKSSKKDPNNNKTPKE